MKGRFTGWSDAAFDVLLRLEGVPSTHVRAAVRNDRERLVRQPMVALLEELATVSSIFEDHSVSHFRTNPWWWQHQCAVARLGRNIEISLRFDLDGLRIQGAWWYPDSCQVDSFRAAVADDVAGSQLQEIIENLEERGFGIEGDVMSRVPRGYPRNHPRADLLRHRSVLAIEHLGCDEWLYTPTVIDRVLAATDELYPLMSWLVDHVGSASNSG
ncbi:DUF2461 family protein [Nocardia arthritidis]|uniref:DUF2461 family protein n=1 Tax=Nocardia arthritidis TaxID=228602 RepID=A0A6G9Y9H6_9NOCA|nr:DUF2461 family protein [Nocardia arthritidis]QIS09879.1 DUF2461 family protein [Nocardia arthritidis]